MQTHKVLLRLLWPCHKYWSSCPLQADQGVRVREESDKQNGSTLGSDQPWVIICFEHAVGRNQAVPWRKQDGAAAGRRRQSCIGIGREARGRRGPAVSASPVAWTSPQLGDACRRSDAAEVAGW